MKQSYEKYRYYGPIIQGFGIWISWSSDPFDKIINAFWLGSISNMCGFGIKNYFLLGNQNVSSLWGSMCVMKEYIVQKQLLKVAFVLVENYILSAIFFVFK